MEAPHCESCFFILKKLDSCPNTADLQDANIFDFLVQTLWVVSSIFPFILVAFFGAGLLKGRTPRLMLITGCLVVQVAVNELILKNIFAELRPTGSCSHSFGLPSGHSSFASFFMTWLILEGIYISEHASFKKEKYYIHLRNIGIFFSPLVPISRFFLNYHTVKQICAGMIIGFFVAVTCFYYLIGKGYQAWYEGELMLAKAQLEESLTTADLEADEYPTEAPKVQKNTSLQPIQSIPENELSL